MTLDPKAKIDRIIDEGIDFKFGDYISRGFELLQKDLGSYIGFTAILIVISGVIGLIPFVGSVANSLVISPALTVGAYLFARKLDKRESTEFGDFFKGFDFTAQLAIAALVKALIIGVTLIPFGIMVWNSGLVDWYMEVVANPGTPPESLPEMPPFWSFLLLLPAVFLSVAYAWTYLFIAFHKMEFWDAMEASRRLLTKNWLVYFAFSIVVGFIIMAGVFLLCIGLLASIPAGYCMIYAAFADVTKLNEEPSEGDGIEEHLIA